MKIFTFSYDHLLVKTRFHEDIKVYDLYLLGFTVVDPLLPCCHHGAALRPFSCPTLALTLAK